MNKIHRLVWSAARQTWIAASEISSSRGKSASTRKGIVGGIATALIATLPLHAHAAPPAPNTLPSGGQIVAGQAAIAQSGSQMTISQTTNQAILNWNTFNIGANAAVNFQQPSTSAVALNRVVGSDPSALYGKLSANGQVFLVNPNGVLFGQGARVDVGGMVASTLNIRNEDFLAGNYRFTRDGATAGVSNQGELLGKYIALLAPEVRNEGIVTARQGTVALAAGDAVTLSITGNNLIDVQVDKASINTLVENKHLVQADAGTVILSAQSANQLLGQVVNSGAVEASGIISDGGIIRLRASSSITNTGTLRADAGANGKGGSITAIADLTNPNSQTIVDGSLSAKGGSQAGDGGFIETSASHLKIADTANINTTAANGNAGQWLLDPVDFTIAAANGDITGAALATALTTSGVTIQTATTGTNTAAIKYGTSGINGDIFVNDSVSWAANTLTLNASRNIVVNAPMTATGTAGLALKYGQAALNAGSTDSYSVNAPVNIASTGSFSTQLGSDGAITTFTVVTTEAALINIGTALAGNYVLGSNITSTTNTTTNPWVPLGNTAGNITNIALVKFTGTLDGLGHTINGLTRANTANSTGVGLFGEIGTGAKVQNLGLTNVNLAGLGSVGALAGINGGTIKNVYATGTITGSDVVGGSAVGSIGGLIGQNNSSISNSYANVAVTATTGSQTLGAGADGGIGGLVGVHNTGFITTSYAAGNVSGIMDVGGLVGYANASITSSYARGAVTGTTNVGGLLGQAGMVIGAGAGLLNNTYWDTTTSGRATSASAGMNSSTGLATASIKLLANVAALDFTNTWVIYDTVSYPLLRSMLTPLIVTAANKSKTYDGLTYSGGYTNVYSLTAPDTTQYTGTVAYGGAGGTGTTAVNTGNYAITPSGLTLTNAAMANQHGYLISYVDGALSINAAAVTAISLNGTRVYDGTNSVNASIFTLSGLVGTQTLTLTGAGTVADKNVGNNKPVTLGTLALGNGTNGGLASNYTFTGGTHTASITAAPLTITSTMVSKTYDGGTSAAGRATVSGGTLFGTDSVSGGTFAFTDKNVGSGNKAVTVSGVTVNDGNVGGNYTVTYANNTASTITAKALTVTATGTNKVYDGLTTASVTLADNRITGDLLTLANTSATFADKNVANAKPVSVTGINVTGADAGNYTFNATASTTASTTASITAKALTVSGITAAAKVYDGTTAATVSTTGATLTGLVTNDVVTVSATGVFSDKNAGIGKIVTLGYTGADVSNYLITSQTPITASITAANLTLSTSNVSKTYDGTTTATVTATVSSGTLFGTDSLSGGTFAFTDKNVGNGNKIVTVSGVTLNDGNGGGNYSVTYANNTTSTITPAPITVKAADQTRAYGSANPTTGTVTLTAGSLGTGDALSTATVSSTATGTTANGQTAPLTPSNQTFSAGAAGNYTISYLDGVLTVNDPETAAVAATAVTNIGQISGGKGMVSMSQTGSTTTLTQQGNHLLLDWSSFGIPSANTLTFAQPGANSVAVNRITDSNPTQIFGKLTSNGIVFLINPSGIVFNPTASIDVGELVASALTVKGFESTVTPANVVWVDKDTQVFNANRLSFTGSGGTLNNQANLNLGAGKFWGFYGKQVVNDGSITVAGGTGTHSDSWKDANTLTLSSQGNITLNSALNIQGNGKLLLESGQGFFDAGNPFVVNTFDYQIKAPVNLAATSSFATRLGSDGTLANYTVITDLAGLRGMTTGTNYALGSNIDASATKTGTAFAAVNLNATLAGLGHSVNDLKGNGFIGRLSGGAVRDIGMVNVSVSGTSEVGGLVGRQQGGTISNSYASGSVSGTSYEVGGLVGLQMGSISNSYASGAVSGTSQVAGLVGSMQMGSSSNGTALTATAATAQASYAGFDFTNVWAINAGQSAPYLRGMTRPPATTITGSSVTVLPNQQQVYNSVASVLSAALASSNQTKTSSGASVSSLATQTTKLLEQVRTAAPAATTAATGTQTSAQANTQTTTQTPQQAMTQAISQMKQIVAAQCSSCSFSDADYQAWATGGKKVAK